MSAAPTMLVSNNHGDTTLGVLAMPDGRLWLTSASIEDQRCVELTDHQVELLYHALEHFLHCESCRAGRAAADGYDKAIKTSVE